MQCPVCNVELVMADRQGIEIDYCPKCRGVWLDRGELDKIIERTSAPAPAAPGGRAFSEQQRYREEYRGGHDYRRDHDHDHDHDHDEHHRYDRYDDDDHHRHSDHDRYYGQDYYQKKRRGGAGGILGDLLGGLGGDD